MFLQENDKNSSNISAIFITSSPVVILPKKANLCSKVYKTVSAKLSRTNSVLNCFNNSRKNKEVSFAVLPSNVNVRKKWLQKVTRENFVPPS